MMFFWNRKKTAPAKASVPRREEVPLRKSEAALWYETINPLQGLTAKEVQAIFDVARCGNYSRLQYIYQEIERTDPTLLISTSRRMAALSELDWGVVRNDERLNRGDWGSLADEQTAYLETAMAQADNLPDAIEHLGLAPFRGYSHISPVLSYAGDTVRHFDLPDTWNFAQDRATGSWLWNPGANTAVDPSSGAPDLQAIPPEELVTVASRTAIDWPALMIFLRLSVGEREWGRFLEAYGQPPVVVTMPEGVNKGEEAPFAEAAREIYEAHNGALPFGSGVSYASDARGVDPFTGFLSHQQKLIVLMATGGTLTSLAEAGSGTLAGNAHQETWKQIARRDARISSQAINKQLCEALVRRAFPGRPVLVEWRLDTEPKPTPSEVLDLAVKASQAGLQIDPEELSAGTGYTITVAPPPPAGGPLMMSQQAPQPGVVLNDGQPGETVAPPAPPPPSRGRDLAAAIRKDHAELAERLEALLELPEDQAPAAAAALLDELDELAGGDTALAEAIAGDLAAGFTEAL